jgi:hypothetical protein
LKTPRLRSVNGASVPKVAAAELAGAALSLGDTEATIESLMKRRQPSSKLIE